MADEKKEQAHSASVDELKSAFKEGATPNEKDYGALIDLAAVGSKALGANDATPTTPDPGDGLKMVKDKLTVREGNGIEVNGNGVAVRGDGTSVTVTKNGVGIQVKADGGLATDTGKGLHVKLGAGMISTTKGGLAINLADKSGLKAETSGLAVNVAAGLEFDKQGALTVKVRTGGDNYITSDKDGLAITKEGVTAIEKALKNVSLGALQKADAATSHGYKVDTTPAEPKEGVQKQIAEKLNEAFTEGWRLTQPRAALFTALKAFRTANIGKIFKEGLIAPSAVTGKTGLYNQAGEEYVAGTVIAFKVNSAGEAQEVKPGVYTADGIYALVGRLGEAGGPTTSEIYDRVTPHALMVLVAQKVVTVVGHWDFNRVQGWEANENRDAWSPAPPLDSVAIAAEHARTVERDKPLWVAEASKQGYWAGMKTALGKARVELGGAPKDATFGVSGSVVSLAVDLAPSRWQLVGSLVSGSTYRYEIAEALVVYVGGVSCDFEAFSRNLTASEIRRLNVDNGLGQHIRGCSWTVKPGNRGVQFRIEAGPIIPFTPGHENDLPRLPGVVNNDFTFHDVTLYEGKVYLPNSLGHLELKITL